MKEGKSKDGGGEEEEEGGRDDDDEEVSGAACTESGPAVCSQVAVGPTKMPLYTHV